MSYSTILLLLIHVADKLPDSFPAVLLMVNFKHQASQYWSSSWFLCVLVFFVCLFVFSLVRLVTVSVTIRILLLVANPHALFQVGHSL